MRRIQGVAAACLAAGLTLATAQPGWADARHQLHRQQQQAAHLDAQARQQAHRLAGSRQTLQRLNARANTALAALQQASLAAQRAGAERDAAQQALARAQQRTAAARERIDQTAAGAYRSLAAGGHMAATLSLVESGNPQAFLDGLQLLGQVGQHQAGVFDDLRVAEAVQLRSEHLVAIATARAVTAERAAATAKQRVDALVVRQQAAVAQQQRLLAQTRGRAAHAHQRASALQRQIAAAEARAAALRRAQARAAAAGNLPTPGCDGSSVAGYSNGRLPTKALCPLWEAPGQMLQAAAAGAFDRMSKAYDQVFGVPLCVTASYRTYQRQVELYATMPAGYAAVPGTSNHGWALAVDLCGGIQVDNSPQHQWLLSHAAAFGWFHPAWARPGGPGPHEPWHWEYAG
ncbi:MAG TPA: M15 family metallopeptidase [Mycobacteriales bacterium]|nr:M15 family metallopeptidase [Mycobacteriales bacterium]